MDFLYLLEERTRLIREYYEHAAWPFNETIRKIEAEEEPYIPLYSEDPEPAFLIEWIEADELLAESPSSNLGGRTTYFDHRVLYHPRRAGIGAD